MPAARFRPVPGRREGSAKERFHFGEGLVALSNIWFYDSVDQQVGFSYNFILKHNFLIYPFIFLEITRQGPKMKPGDPESKETTPGSAIQPKLNQKGDRI